MASNSQIVSICITVIIKHLLHYVFRLINPIFASAALRYVFALAPSCEVIHGTIYTCLRAMFGLSVIGILVSIFSCMLVYQILRCVTRCGYL